jgi:hypothetical protein
LRAPRRARDPLTARSSTIGSVKEHAMPCGSLKRSVIS